MESDNSQTSFTDAVAEYFDVIFFGQVEILYLQFVPNALKTVEKTLSPCDDKIDNKIF